MPDKDQNWPTAFELREQIEGKEEGDQLLHKITETFSFEGKCIAAVIGEINGGPARYALFKNSKRGYICFTRFVHQYNRSTTIEMTEMSDERGVLSVFGADNLAIGIYRQAGIDYLSFFKEVGITLDETEEL